MVFGFFKYLMEDVTTNRSIRERMEQKGDLEGIVQLSIPTEEKDEAETSFKPEDPQQSVKKEPMGNTSSDSAKNAPSNSEESKPASEEGSRKSDNDQSSKESEKSTQLSTDLNKSNDKVVEVSREEYKEPIKSDYAKKVSEMSPVEIYDNYNPGSTKPDGSVNFECHCVGHLVASPCGSQFRKALTCQKAAGDEGLEKGECMDEFLEFMRCTVETKCFRVKDDESDEQSKDS